MQINDCMIKCFRQLYCDFHIIKGGGDTFVSSLIKIKCYNTKLLVVEDESFLMFKQIFWTDCAVLHLESYIMSTNQPYIYISRDHEKSCFPWYDPFIQANMTQRFSAPSFGFSSSSWHSGGDSSGSIYFHRTGLFLDERAVRSHPVILGSFECQPVLSRSAFALLMTPLVIHAYIY